MVDLSQKQLEDFKNNGFIIIKSLFNKKEINLLKKTAMEDRELDKHSFGRADGEGGTIRLSLWNHPGNNIYGMYARSARIVDTTEKLLGGEVYHYHSKMILKDPEIGGAWAWHQDYGYWYQNGVLFPDLLSVFISVDKATKENGCLQVIKGSHKLGRIEHVLTGDQAGANMERVNEVLKRLDLVYCQMEPGDAVFFHSNLLHRSDQNKSKNSRWSLICCYNMAKNDPYKDSHHPRYTKLNKVDDKMILKVGMERFSSAGDDMKWMNPDHDHSSTSL